MMKLIGSAVVLVLVAGVSANYMADKFGENPHMQEVAVQTAPDAPAKSKSQTVKVTNVGEDYSGRNTRIKADRRGHYVTNAKLNGRNVEVLVDTGATSVAINKSTARRLGIKLTQADFKYQVNTANGAVKAAGATIDRVQIGRVSVTNVQAVVLPDQSLSVTLLGMSFLGELRSFEVKSGELVLRQ